MVSFACKTVFVVEQDKSQVQASDVIKFDSTRINQTLTRAAHLLRGRRQSRCQYSPGGTQIQVAY